MATRKTCDRVDLRFNQRFSERIGIKVRSDGFDVFTGVEIEMNLTKAQLSFFQGRIRRFYLFCVINRLPTTISLTCTFSPPSRMPRGASDFLATTNRLKMKSREMCQV